jgi:hypothetical protein
MLETEIVFQHVKKFPALYEIQNGAGESSTSAPADEKIRHPPLKTDKMFSKLCHNFIHSFINGSTALCWALASSSFPSFFLHRRYDSLDGGSARRKAATYTQDNTNTE